MKTLLLIFFLLTARSLFAQDLLQTTVLDSVCIYFDYASSTVKQPQELTKRLSRLKVPTMGRIDIRGYADTTGSTESNALLVGKRIESVQHLIWKSGFKNLKIDSLNFNEQQLPSYTDATNRRVEVVIYELKPSFTYNKPVDLKINFEPGTANILANSTASLEKLLILLQNDKTLTAKLNGHVCCEADYDLSIARARRVKTYLVRAGIDEQRISCEGFSNSQPLAEETSEEAMALNRRVEVVFVGKE